MDGFDFLASKEAANPTLINYQSPQGQGQAQHDSNTSNNNNGSNTNNTNNDMQFDISQIDQFVENLNQNSNFDNFGTVKFTQSNPNTNLTGATNADGSPFSLTNVDFDYTVNNNAMSPNNYRNISIGADTGGNSIANIDSIEDYGAPDLSKGNPMTFNADDFRDSNPILSPQAIPSTSRMEGSGSISSYNPNYVSPHLKPYLSTSINNQRAISISNQGGRSYSSQLGTSLNNLISPASTYDGYLDSPYGSYQGSSFNDTYLKSPVNSPSFKAMGSPVSVGSHLNPKNSFTKESKLNRRRELHNAVERRRRDLIKEKIKEMGTLIPPPLLYDSTKSKSANKEIKANKSTILAKCVEYIGYLQDISQSQDEKLSLLTSKIEELSKLEQSGSNISLENDENFVALPDSEYSSLDGLRSQTQQYNAPNTNSSYEFSFDSPTSNTNPNANNINNSNSSQIDQQQNSNTPVVKSEDPSLYFQELLSGTMNPSFGNIQQQPGGNSDIWNL